MLIHLADLAPQVTAAEMIADLVPPDLFAHVNLDNYVPDPAYPSQERAREAVREFVAAMKPPQRTGLFARRASRDAMRLKPGLYLDGGFGVGKTHLLAAAWHAAPAPKAFGTFIEYTAIVGALGYRQAAEALAGFRLICIDEFELDDPGDTLMMTRLLSSLVKSGARVIATSNTPPDALGEGRFAAADFLREIQALAEVFTPLRIDGEDYRARALGAGAASWSAEGFSSLVERLARDPGTTVAVDDFMHLAESLQQVHPVKYASLARATDVVAWSDLHQLTNQNEALRMVALIDRLYDNQIALVSDGIEPTSMFAADMLAGGYRKKYLRAISRLGAMSELGRELDEATSTGRA